MCWRTRTFTAPSVRRWLPAFEHWRMPVRPDRLRLRHPRAELGLRELRMLLLELNPVRVAALEVLHEHLARDLVLAALGDREVDLQERVRVAVEHGWHPVFFEQLDVLEPVDVLARRRSEEIDVLEQRDVLLVRETMTREGLGVDRPRAHSTSSVGCSGR